MELEHGSLQENKHFSGENFKSAKLYSIKFKNCIFDNCDLTGASFDGSHLDNVQFNNCRRMKNMSFRKAYVNSVGFKDCELTNTKFQQNYNSAPKLAISRSKFHKCSFAGLRLDGTTYDSVVFDTCDFTSANLYKAHFNNCDFIYTKGMVLGEQIFTNSKLVK